MSLATTLENDFKNAMLNRQKDLVDLLRLLKAALKREHYWFSDIRRIGRSFPVFKLKATGSDSYYSYCFCVIASQQSPKSLSIWRSCSKDRPPVVR